MPLWLLCKLIKAAHQILIKADKYSLRPWGHPALSWGHLASCRSGYITSPGRWSLTCWLTCWGWRGWLVHVAVMKPGSGTFQPTPVSFSWHVWVVTICIPPKCSPSKWQTNLLKVLLTTCKVTMSSLQTTINVNTRDVIGIEWVKMNTHMWRNKQVSTHNFLFPLTLLKLPFKDDVCWQMMMIWLDMWPLRWLNHEPDWQVIIMQSCQLGTWLPALSANNDNIPRKLSLTLNRYTNYL